MIEARYKQMIDWLGQLIDYRETAATPPPRTLVKFFTWALSGAWPIIFLAGAISAIAGGSEVLAMYFLGRIVDIAASSDPLAQPLGCSGFFGSVADDHPSGFVRDFGVFPIGCAWAEPVRPCCWAASSMDAWTGGSILRQRFCRPYRAKTDAGVAVADGNGD